MKKLWVENKPGNVAEAPETESGYLGEGTKVSKIKYNGVTKQC